MRRRKCLCAVGTILSTVTIAGCLSGTSKQQSADSTIPNQSTETATGSTTGSSTNTTTSPCTNTTTSPSTDTTTESPASTITTSTTDTTTEPTTTTSMVTLEPPANRLLRPRQLGESWEYTDESMPRTTDKGTITGVYRTTRNYTRTVRTRLWPCEGETLKALGGTCSLGNLPAQKRANESVETTDRSLGETAFLWWTDIAIDIEVVTANHVFRLTHKPIIESNTNTSQNIPSRDARIEEVTDIAQLQADKLARRGCN